MKTNDLTTKSGLMLAIFASLWTQWTRAEEAKNSFAPVQAYRFLTDGKIGFQPELLYAREFSENASKAMPSCAQMDTTDPKAAEGTFLKKGGEPKLSSNSALRGDLDDIGGAKPFEIPIFPACQGNDVEIGTQGFFPVASVITKDDQPTYERTSFFKVADLSEYSVEGDYEFMNYNVFGAGFRSYEQGGKVAFDLHPFLKLVSGTTQFQYKLHTEAAKASVKISFLEFLEGGNTLKLRIQEDGFLSDDWRNSIEHLEFDDGSPQKFITWEGNFRLKGCEEDAGLKQAHAQKKVTSIADLVSREDEMELPGYRNCTFVADIATSADLLTWNDHHKFLVPTLKNVSVVLNSQFANISYLAYDGVPFRADRVLIPKTSSASSQAVKATQGLTSEILEILKGTVPVISQDKDDRTIPHVQEYLKANSDKLHELLGQLTDAVKMPGVPFMEVFNSMVSLRRAYIMLDQALGVLTQKENTLGSLLQIPTSGIPIKLPEEEPVAPPPVTEVPKPVVTSPPPPPVLRKIAYGGVFASSPHKGQRDAVNEALKACQDYLAPFSPEEKALGNANAQCDVNPEKDCSSTQKGIFAAKIYVCKAKVVAR